MASRFSAARQFLEQKAQDRRSENSIDALVKRAQLGELGYDVTNKPTAFGIFGGGQMITQRPDYVSTKGLERRKLETENSINDIKLKRMQDGSKAFGSGAIPEGFTSYLDPNTGEEKIVKDPNFITPYQKSRMGQDSLTPGQQMAKVKATDKIYETVEANKMKRKSLADATKALPNVPQGILGKMEVGWKKAFKPNDPMLEDWQKIKIIGTDAQLLNTAKTKGAISDREMALFAQAAANDDILSVPRLKPVLERISKALDAEESGMFGAYERNYGEDPRQWFGQVQNNQPKVKYQVVAVE